MAPWFEQELPDRPARVPRPHHRASTAPSTGWPTTRSSACSPRRSPTSSRQHVVRTMDPVELRASIIDEHAELARVIAAGDAERRRAADGPPLPNASTTTSRRRYPARLAEAVQWR